MTFRVKRGSHSEIADENYQSKRMKEMQTGCEKESEIFAKKQSFTRLARYDLKLKILLMENTRNRYFISSI